MTLRELVKQPEIQRARIGYDRLRYWVYVGLGGKKLPTTKIGGVRYTTAERVLVYALQEEEPKSFELPPQAKTYAVTEHRFLESLLNRNKKGQRDEIKKNAKTSDQENAAEARPKTNGVAPAPDSGP